MCAEACVKDTEYTIDYSDIRKSDSWVKHKEWIHSERETKRVDNNVYYKVMNTLYIKCA